MRNLRNLTVEVDLLAGSNIRESCCDLCELADRIGVTVEAKFNGITLLASPDSNPLELREKWDECMSGKTKHKFASV